MKSIEIHTDWITLEGLLKYGGVVQTGGQAKALIQSGGVKLNGSIETRRSKKVYPGDRVETGDLVLVVVGGRAQV